MYTETNTTTHCNSIHDGDVWLGVGRNQVIEPERRSLGISARLRGPPCSAAQWQRHLHRRKMLCLPCQISWWCWQAGISPTPISTGFSTHRPTTQFSIEKPPSTLSRGIIFRAIEPFKELSFVGRLSSIVRTPKTELNRTSSGSSPARSLGVSAMVDIS
jgi:hypothetical protein